MMMIMMYDVCDDNMTFNHVTDFFHSRKNL